MNRAEYIARFAGTLAQLVPGIHDPHRVTVELVNDEPHMLTDDLSPEDAARELVAMANAATPVPGTGDNDN